MRRVDLYLHEKQFNFLVAQQGTLSEVIRRAIDDYIEKIRAIKVSGSQSQRKEGDTNE